MTHGNISCFPCNVLILSSRIDLLNLLSQETLNLVIYRHCFLGDVKQISQKEKVHLRGLQHEQKSLFLFRWLHIVLLTREE